MNINAGWTSDTLDYVTFFYSNGQSNQHGQQNGGYSPYTSVFDLNPKERINGVTVYTGIRAIDNPYEPNGSYLVVGLRFYTDQGRTSDLFGSSNGTQTDEIVPNSTIAYVQGRAFGYLDALQFIWYRKISIMSTAVLSTY